MLLGQQCYKIFLKSMLLLQLTLSIQFSKHNLKIKKRKTFGKGHLITHNTIYLLNCGLVTKIIIKATDCR